MTNNKLHFWMVLAMLFWGASWPIANVLANYIDVHEFISYRYIFTTVSMAGVVWWMKLDFKINMSQLLVAIISATLLIYYSKYYFLSTKYSPPGLAGAVVTTLMPVLVYLLMVFSRQKQTQIKDWMALLLGVIGVLTTMNIWQFNLDEILTGTSFYLIAAASFWAVMSIAIPYAKSINPITFSFYIYLMVVVIDGVLFFEPTHGSIFAMDLTFWLNFLVVSLGSTTFATTIYFVGLKQLGAKQGSVFTFLVPFFAVGLSVVFLDEAWHWTTVVGALMTISALIILNKIKIGFYNKP